MQLLPTPSPSPRAREDQRDADGLHRAEVTSVRAWARSRGYPIDETSGVPLAVLHTYRKVHAG